MMEVKPHRHPGVFVVHVGGRVSLATRSMVKGQSVYGEKTVQFDDDEYRIWAPRKSKLAAALHKGLERMPIREGVNVLYLGAASGTTVSHVSDIVGATGTVYAVEFSARIARELVQLARTRDNIVPIVADARHPVRYAPIVSDNIEVVYQDVAQPDQASILNDNMQEFCCEGAYGMIAIKARSIDSVIDSRHVFDREVGALRGYGLNVIETINLHPLEKDHLFAVVRIGEENG